LKHFSGKFVIYCMERNLFNNLFYALIPILILSVMFVVARKESQTSSEKPVAPTMTESPEPSILNQVPAKEKPLDVPMENALERITKKPFGVLIRRDTSPVQPERFSGFHTGVDFEVLEDELSKEVPVLAICAGPVIYKKFATGYGGIIVQSCALNGPVTVVYGHVGLDKSPAKLGKEYALGEKLGVLGDAESRWTDGERKHLHLGIHRGDGLNIQGYVQDKSLLSNWIDFEVIGTK
jgi:hypothetical protein